MTIGGFYLPLLHRVYHCVMHIISYILKALMILNGHLAPKDLARWLQKATDFRLKPTPVNVYLLVCHVPFLAKGAGFLLQCTILYLASRRRALYKKARSTFVQRGAFLEHLNICKNPAPSEKPHDRPTELFFRLNTLCTQLSGSNL